jgi:hypothetical protein
MAKREALELRVEQLKSFVNDEFVERGEKGQSLFFVFVCFVPVLLLLRCLNYFFSPLPQLSPQVSSMWLINRCKKFWTCPSSSA